MAAVGRPKSKAQKDNTDYLGNDQPQAPGSGDYLPTGPPTLPTGVAPPQAQGSTYNGGFTNSTSPGQMLSQNRMNIQGQGQAIINQTGGAQNYFSNLGEGYRQAGDQAYTNLAHNPGYSPQQNSQINADYSKFNTSPGELNKQYLTADEQAGVAGAPTTAFKYFNPQAVNDIANTGANNMANVAQQENQWLSGNIDREGLQIDPTYAGKVGDTLGQTRGDVTGSLGDAKSGVNKAISGSAKGIGDYLGQEGQSINSTTNDPSLGLSGNFLPKYQMSDSDVQDLENQSSRSVGTRYQNEQDALQRSAAADGNASPAAMAAARARLQQQEGVQSADALTDARIGAKNAQAQRLQTGEGMRLGAAQQQAGMKLQGAETLGQQGTQAQEYLGGLGAQSALELGQEGIGAGEALGNQALNANQQTEQMRTADKQYLTNTLENAAATAGNQYMNAVQGGTAAQTAAQEYGQTTGTNLGLQTEAEQAQRAAALAQNRQATTAGINATQYQQGVGSQQATAQGAQAVGNAQVAGMNNYRNYLTGQQGQAQNGYLTSQGQQIQGYGVQAQGTNQAGTGQVQNMGTGTSPASYLQAVSGFLADGGVVNKPTLATIGEHGPEMVIPLTRRPRRYGAQEAA